MVKRTQIYNVNDIFERRVYESDGYKLPYRLYIPQDYDCGEKYPVMLFLHGAGERGSDNENQINFHFQQFFDDPESPVYDAIVIAPQCPSNSQWVLTPWAEGNYSTENVPESRELESVCAILDEIKDYCNVDEDRIYVTGLSMGGFGTWDLLMRHGARFAAGMPICGGGDPSYAKLLSRIPIRTFHGSDDNVVPVKGTRLMYAAIKREGGENIEYTEFDGCGHGSWVPAYADKENIKWLFSQSREERRLKSEKKEKIKKVIAAGGAGAILSAILILLGVKKHKKK
ncbi:MAG: phospholipase [Ruminococcaceae bacterium]|nr:phospholipase [Oscillospiraceae bacterium]